MVKCDLCDGKIQTTFLNKLIGTFVRDKNGKKKVICNSCQKLNKDKNVKDLF